MVPRLSSVPVLDSPCEAAVKWKGPGAQCCQLLQRVGQGQSSKSLQSLVGVV